MKMNSMLLDAVYLQCVFNLLMFVPISGVMLVISAILYTLKTYKAQKDHIAEERVKAQQSYDTYDR